MLPQIEAEEFDLAGSAVENIDGASDLQEGSLQDLLSNDARGHTGAIGHLAAAHLRRLLVALKVICYPLFYEILRPDTWIMSLPRLSAWSAKLLNVMPTKIGCMQN
ncbi:MAG: hypothetical protein ACRCWJ_19435 [Casimicrobium sp.]